MSCIDQIDLCLTRGDGYTLNVELDDNWVEVIETPTDYSANLVFREVQDDSVTPYLTLSSSPVVTTDPLPGDQPVIFTFTATPAETQALPDWDIVAYCELVYVPGAIPRRLFNSEVDIND